MAQTWAGPCGILVHLQNFLETSEYRCSSLEMILYLLVLIEIIQELFPQWKAFFPPRPFGIYVERKGYDQGLGRHFGKQGVAPEGWSKESDSSLGWCDEQRIIYERKKLDCY